MAYELVNDGDATPNRLHGLLRLVARYPGMSVAELCELLQPPSLTANTSAASVVLDAAFDLELLLGSEKKGGAVRLTVPREAIEEAAAFRETMTQLLLGVTDGDAKNYVFNLFTAWYATRDAEVLRATGAELTEEFNRRVFPGTKEQVMNDQKFPAWRVWATFLGYGWGIPRGNTRVMVPDCHNRMGGLTDAWLPDDGQPVPFAAFVEQLGADCPELDGGTLFARAVHWGAAAQDRGRRVSLMLSTALRRLHDARRCELMRLADAQDVWRLFPASGHEMRDVTHIRRGNGRTDA